jgi:hypothetical protein
MTGSHDTFDLKIINNDQETAYLEFDHIIDPDTGVKNLDTVISAPNWNTPENILGAGDGINCAIASTDPSRVGVFRWDSGTFSIPAGSTIDGIQLVVKAWGGKEVTWQVELSENQDWTGGSSQSTTESDGGSGSCDEWGDETLGGATDLWGRAADPPYWTPSNINDGIYTRFTSVAGNSDGDIYVDAVDLTIYYTAPANYAPEISNPYPANESTNIPTTPTLNITVSDAEGDTMDITWYSNSSGSWVSFGTNSSVGNGTYHQTNSNFSTSGTTYWWNVSVNDGTDTNNSGIFQFTTSYAPVLSNPGPANESTGQSLTPVCNITVSDQDGGTVDVYFYENTTGGWVLQQTNSSVDVSSPANVVWDNYNNATSYVTTYWWSVNCTDGNGGWTNETYHFTTRYESPSVVTNASTGVEETNATLHGYLQNNGSADTTCWFLWGVQNPPTDQNVTQGVIANQTEFSYDTSGTAALNKGTLYYFDTKANNSGGWNESGGVKTFLTKPDPPNTLTATANSSTMIYLTLNKGTGANNTYIERNASGQTVWARGQGTQIYNDTGTNYEDTGLTSGVTYYYQAWSYTTWTYDSTTLHQWSDDNDTANTQTPTLPTVHTNESTGVEETNATLRGYLSNNGSADTTCGFRYGTSSGSYSENFSKGVIANQTEFSNDNGSLTQGQIYFYQAWANNSAGFNGTANEKTFLTKPDPATSITITNITDGFNISWTHAAAGNYNTSVLRYKTTGYPTSPTDGTEAYNGTDNYYEHTGLVAGTTYYYRVWEFANWTYDSITLHKFSDGNESDSQTYVTAPMVTTNASTGVEETNATLRGYLSNDGGLTTTCGFRYGTSSGSYTENFTKGTYSSGTEFSNNNGSLTSGDLYYYQAWASNSKGFANGSELKFFTKPPAVTNLAESSSTNTSLTYTWTEATVGTGATAWTRIQYKTGSYPTSISDGTNTYNGTDETDDTTGLEPGTHYYFSAFSWGIEDSVGNWNDTYDTMDAWTNPGDPTNPSTTNGSTWINITFTHGTNGSHTMVRRNATGSPDFPADRTSGVEVANTTNTYANDTGLVALGVTYYYALWTWDTDGGKWCDYQTNITGTTWNLSRNATPSQWPLGNVWIGGSNTSTGFYFNITNEGDATLNIQIKASNATNSSTGAQWNLTLTPEHNNFTLEYNKSGDGGWTIINTTYDIFVTNLVIDGYQTFDLKMTHATTSSTLDPMSLTVTFKSVAS